MIIILICYRHLIYVNSFQLCHPLLSGFVTVQNWKNNGEKPNMTIMFPFYNLFKYATVCLFSIYYKHRSKMGAWPQSDIPLVRQSDTPTALDLFYVFPRIFMLLLFLLVRWKWKTNTSLSDYRTLGLSDCEISGLSVYRTVGLTGCPTINSFRLTTVKNTMLIYVNSFQLCHPLLSGFVTV
jgi:hypothetical protein